MITSQVGILDGTCEKAILKEQIVIRPRSGDNNWQTWSEAMELLPAARMLWDKADGNTSRPNLMTRPKDYKA